MRFDTLDAWLDWQSGLHSKGIDLGLDRVRQAYEKLGAKSPAPIVISVAGTNGKGSTVAMLESILGAAGYRTGSYTSPHIHHYNERIRLDGQPVDDQLICDSFARIDEARGEISLTYFEFGTLAALDILSRQSLDVAILEVGLGGRLDAVNIVDADVAIVTSIDLDHMDWLGDSREKIALEKLGIGRAGKPVIIGDPNPPTNMQAEAKEQGMQVRHIGQEYGFQQQEQQWSWWRDSGEKRHALPYPALRGLQQLYNASGVIEALSCLADRLPVGQNELRQGLEGVQLAGRFDIRQNGARMILDVGHNPQAGRMLADNLARLQTVGRSDALVAMLEDKDARLTLAPLKDRISHWWLASLDVPRGGHYQRLYQALTELDVPTERIHCYDSVQEALQAARAQLIDEDNLLIFGSFYTVSQADEALQ